MGNRQDSLVSKLLLDNFLNRGVSLEVDASSGLVNEHNSLGVEEGSGDIEQLFFSCTQVVSSFGNFKVDTALLFEVFPYSAELESILNLFVSVSSSRVDVFLDCSSEHEVVLQDDVDVRPELFETQPTDVLAVNHDPSCGGLQDSEETKHHSAFSTASTTDDSDLLSGSHNKTQVLEDIFAFWFVPETEVFEGDLSSWEDLSTEVDFFEVLIFDEVFLEVLHKAFFRLELGELIALSQGLEPRSEGVETHIESDDAIFQSEVVEDKEDDVRMEVRLDKQQR